MSSSLSAADIAEISEDTRQAYVFNIVSEFLSPTGVFRQALGCISVALTSESKISLCYISFTMSLAALAVYELLITIGGEVEFVWKRKRTFGSWLFIINRYLLLVYTIVLPIPGTSLGVCLYCATCILLC